MKEESLKILTARVKEEPPVEFVLILPRPTIGWPTIKQEKDVKPKLVPTVKIAKFDAKWPSHSMLFQIFYSCPHCQLVVKTRGGLTRHLRTCSKLNTARFECDCCGGKFQNKKVIRAHMLKHSSEKRFFCNRCGFGFKTKTHFMNHSRTKKIYKYAVCDVKFACKLLLDRHRNDFHGNIFKCDKCSYQTKIKRDLTRHKGTHDKSIACDTCQRKFSSDQSLKLHQTTHRHGIHATTPEETFDCDKCGKSFSSSQYLKKHQKIAHDASEVKCEVCGKVFRNKTNLHKHSQFHNKVECAICHKMISKYKMASHLRSHSAENHFKCDLCDHSAKTKDNFKKHIEAMHLLKKLVNDSKRREDFSEFELLEKLLLKYGSSATTSEKKFKCDKCAKAFVTPTRLNKHKRTVHPNKLFECEICKKAFKTKSHLNRHNVKVHSMK